jgi:flagellin
MASNIVLSAGVRQNLLALQSTAQLMSVTQNRLATGKKVNSALDNPTNFFTSSSLQRRANDLNALLDAMSNGVRTIEAADNGLTSITKALETMRSTLHQARQDKSFKTSTYAPDAAAIAAASIDTNAEARLVSFTGGAVGSTPVNVDLSTATGRLTAGLDYVVSDFDNGGVYGAGVSQLSFNLTLNGGVNIPVAIRATSPTNLTITVNGFTAATNTVGSADTVSEAELIDTLNAGLTAAGAGITATDDAGSIVFTADAATGASTAAVGINTIAGSNTVVAANFGFAAPVASFVGGGVTARTVDQLVSTINAHASLNGRIRASNDNGRLRIENQSTQILTVGGYNTTSALLDGSGGSATIGGNEVRTELADQFNGLRDQLDKLSDDASFNGVNLLRGDKLTMTFNETSTTVLDIQTENGQAINSAYLGITDLVAADLDTDTGIDVLLGTMKDALNTITAQASTFGSNLSMVENRVDFTKNMIKTLTIGADALVLADTNEEGANLLALQTRQQLSTTALSLSAQADQAVLRLFG